MFGSTSAVRVREVEQQVLGSMMTEPQIVEILGTDMTVFFTTDHQLIYNAILKSYEDNDAHVDPMLVLDKLEAHSEENRAGGHIYLYDIYAQITETESTIHYAKIVKRAAIRRNSINKSEKIRAVATDRTMSNQAFEEMVLEEAASINRRRGENGESVITDSVPFPESLIEGVFDEYVEAYNGCTEVSSSFLFGTLKTVIGASLGRRVSLAGTVPIYPNFFTCVVGHTALARKSTALHLAEHILGQADMGVFILRSLATPEGLLAALTLTLAFHTTREADGGTENRRTDTPSRLCRQGGKNAGAGVLALPDPEGCVGERKPTHHRRLPRSKLSAWWTTLHRLICLQKPCERGRRNGCRRLLRESKR